ncbi:DC-STAMP domain-containing protein 2-like [Aplysia californica]|uniref:DC-STAMP domain-containing protein 2-like n=1 Tax=Aplysia californica TaxID=6500 RepID=A0ABM1VWU9_APLCA|nr:DC-STAMP domain-containing protein 2-like [Aplysia californica]
MLAAIRRFADDLRRAFKALSRAVEEIVSMVSSLFSWLASMVDVCNKNMGEPYRKCKKAFEDGYNDCSDALGIFDFLCNIVSAVSQVCHLARIGELLCVIAGVVKDLVLEKIGPPLASRIGDLQEMFYFKVSIDYHYHYNMNQSKPYR